MGFTNLFSIVPTYFVWHYTRALLDLERLSTNVLWFTFHLFSIGILLQTLFSPWKMLARDETAHHPTFFTNLAVNLLMRVVGFLIRMITISIGLLFFIAGTAFFIVLFIVWLFLPFLVVASFLYGISFFISIV